MRAGHVEFNNSARRMPKRWTSRSLRKGGPNYTIIYELESYELNSTLPDVLFKIPVEGKDLVFKDGKYMLQTKDGQFLHHAARRRWLAGRAGQRR